MLALVVWLAFAFGGVLPLSHAVVAGVAGFIGLLTTVRVIWGGVAMWWSWSFVPAFGFAGFVGLQAIEWPTSLLARVAPATAATWRARLSEPPLSDGVPSALPLSLYPDGTAECLPLLLSAAIIFVVGVQLYRDAARLRRLCMTVVACGVSLSLVTILVNLVGVPPPGFSIDPYSPLIGGFVHYGHGAEFVNLALGCAFAVILARMCGRLGLLDNHVTGFVADLRWPGRRVDRALIAAVVLCAFAVTVSRSRMGLISMCAAGVVLTLVLQRTRVLRGTPWLAFALFVALLVCLLPKGVDLVYDRFAAVGLAQDSDAGRLALVRDTLRMFARFPAFGVGQGAYEFVFPLFDESARGGRAQHAENFYAESLAEVGLCGLALQLWFVLSVLRVWVVRATRPADTCDVVALGMMFGAVAVLAHGMTDFGLRVPAIGLTLLLLAAAVVSGSSAVCSARSSRALTVVTGGCAALLLVFGVPRAWQMHRADALWRRAEAIGSDTSVGGGGAPAAASRPSEQARLVEQALQLRPGHAEYLLRRAGLTWRDANARASAAGSGGDRLSAAQREAAALAQQQALDARRHAPTYGLLWSLAGQLGVGWLEQPGAGDWIIRGMDMSPESPEACVAAASYLLGRDERRAVAAYRRAVEVGGHKDRLMNTLLVDAARPDVAIAVAFDDAQMLLRILPRLQQNPAWGEAAAQARQRAIELLTPLTARASATADELEALARLLLEGGEFVAGKALLRRALVLEPNRPSRLLLAEVLEREGDVEAAIEALERLLIHRPGMPAAVDRLRRLQGR